MAPFNNGYPATYPQVYPQFQPVYQPQYQSPQMGQAQMQNIPQQDMTPTIHAEIKQVDSIEAIDRIPLGAGQSQMFMTKDETAIVIRSMFANGQHSDVVYDKRPPAPPVPVFDPSEYVRKDEMEQLIKEMIANRQKKPEAES
jgi:hypothetical protein